MAPSATLVGYPVPASPAGIQGRADHPLQVGAAAHMLQQMHPIPLESRCLLSGVPFHAGIRLPTAWDDESCTVISLAIPEVLRRPAHRAGHGCTHCTLQYMSYLAKWPPPKTKQPPNHTQTPEGHTHGNSMGCP